MLNRRRCGMAAWALSACLLLGSAGCDVNSATISSLVDLGSMTTGSLVQIVVKGLIQGFLAGLTPPDLTAPISNQMH